MSEERMKSPTRGAEHGTFVTVQGRLVGHHVDGQPQVAFRGLDIQSATLAWINPDDITAVGARPEPTPVAVRDHVSQVRNSAFAYGLSAFWAGFYANASWPAANELGRWFSISAAAALFVLALRIWLRARKLAEALK